jgi:hypothetical protein
LHQKLSIFSFLLFADHNLRLLSDLQNAGIDVAEEVIVMPLSPLHVNFEEETVNEEKVDQNDADFVIDAGLDSDAESDGESPKPRRRNPNGWKRNQQKQKNATGSGYITKKF